MYTPLWHKPLILLLSWLWLAAAAAETQQVDIIVLKNRPAQTLIDVIRPLLAPGAGVSASGNQLVVRSTPEQIAELHLLIDQLDTPLTQFRLSVRLQADRGSQPDDDVVQRSTRRDSGSYTLLALEGYASQIRTAITLPDTVAADLVYPAYLFLDRGSRKLVSDFYATPRLLEGERVLIDISTQVARQSSGSEIDRSYSGAVTGQLGEWLAVGGTAIDAAANSRRRSTGDSRQWTVYIKAERLQ